MGSCGVRGCPRALWELQPNFPRDYELCSASFAGCAVDSQSKWILCPAFNEVLCSHRLGIDIWKVWDYGYLSISISSGNPMRNTPSRWSLTARGMKRAAERSPRLASDGADVDAGARAQLAALEASSCDVGYSALPMPQHSLSIVGGRPFSKVRWGMLCAPSRHPDHARTQGLRVSGTVFGFQLDKPDTKVLSIYPGVFIEAENNIMGTSDQIQQNALEVACYECLVLLAMSPSPRPREIATLGSAGWALSVAGSDAHRAATTGGASRSSTSGCTA